MKTILTALAAILGIGAIPGFAAAPTSNVNVTNTPLPVSVTNPTSAVQISNTSPIGVSVANPLDLVKANASAHFQTHVDGTASANGDSCFAGFPVPSGQRLLIHYVGFRVGTATTVVMMGGELDVAIAPSNQVFQTFFSAVPTVVSTFIVTRNSFIGGQVVDVAADVGSSVFVGVSLSGVDPSVGCEFGISGTLVPSP